MVNGARNCCSVPVSVTCSTAGENVMVCEPLRTLPSSIAAFSVQLPLLSAQVPLPGAASWLQPELLTVKLSAWAAVAQNRTPQAATRMARSRGKDTSLMVFLPEITVLPYAKNDR